MRAAPLPEYRPYEGPYRRGLRLLLPLWHQELARGLQWRFVPLLVVALAPLLLRVAVLYVRFVVAPVRVRLLDRLTDSPWAALLQWDTLSFYAGYLEDGFLWLLLLVVTAAFGVPVLARDRRTRAWELFLARPLTPPLYLAARGLALFTVLFALTFGGVVVLYLCAALLGPEPGFLLGRLHWLLPLAAESLLLCTFLTLAALAFGTLGTHGAVLGGAWLGVHLLGASTAALLRTVAPDGRYDWLNPRSLCVRLGEALRSSPSAYPFGPLEAGLLLGGLGLLCLALLGRFLYRVRGGVL